MMRCNCREIRQSIEHVRRFDGLEVGTKCGYFEALFMFGFQINYVNWLLFVQRIFFSRETEIRRSDGDKYESGWCLPTRKADGPFGGGLGRCLSGRRTMTTRRFSFSESDLPLQCQLEECGTRGGSSPVKQSASARRKRQSVGRLSILIT